VSVASSSRRFTSRAVLLGAIISLLMAIGAPYSRYILHTTPLVFESFSWGVMVCWLTWMMIDAIGGRRMGLWQPFSPSEQALIFMIGTIGSSMTTTELAGMVVTNTAGLPYFASPENRWMETFGTLLPTWLIPSDAHHAAEWLFGGAPPGVAWPWGDWLVPLFWNLSFAAAMYCVQFSLVSLFRKHWVEHERLTFPIMQVPLELVRAPEPGRWAPPWLRGKLFWVGFFIPFIFIMFQVGHWLTPAVPNIPTEIGSISFGPEYPAMAITIFWPVVGISFFANTEVVFSLWFFTILGVLVTGWLNRFGLITAAAQPMQWLNTGALAVMVIWFVWQGRKHLILAAKRALGRAGGEDDSTELVSYRTAYLLLIFGVLYMIVWLGKTGMTLQVALLLIVVSQVIYLGIARLAFEAGVLHVNAPIQACNVIVDALGSANFSRGSLAGLALVFWKFSNIKSIFLATLGHGAALSKSGPVDVPRRSLASATMVVLVLTTIGAIIYTISLGYSRGGYNFGDYVFGGAAQEPYQALFRWLTDPRPADWSRLSFLGIGGALMAMFTALRYALPWWPLHPIGLAICFSYHVSRSFLSFLIAWSVKSLTLRLGGIRLYRKTVPLFIGILVGAFSGGTIAFIVDYFFFPTAGHAVFYY